MTLLWVTAGSDSHRVQAGQCRYLKDALGSMVVNANGADATSYARLALSVVALPFMKVPLATPKHHPYLLTILLGSWSVSQA